MRTSSCSAVVLVCVVACSSGSPPASAPPSLSLSAPATATAGVPFDVQGSALDASNQAVAGVPFVLRDDDTGMSWTATSAGAPSIFHLTLTTAGDHHLRLSGRPESAVATATVPVSPALAAHVASQWVGLPTWAGHLAVRTCTPDDAVAQLELVARDAYGNVVPSFTGTVQFTSSDPLATVPDGYTFVPADRGRHLFAATLSTPGDQTVTITAAGGVPVDALPPVRVGGWCGVGPEAPWVSALATDPITPSIVYAGTLGSGLFKSSDGGASWTSSAGIDARDVTALLVDPRAHTTVYAGADGGIYKSSDSGATWTRKQITDVTAFAADRVSGAVYAATGVGVNGLGIVKSTDSGESWLPANTGLPPPATGVVALALDPGAPATLYAGMNDGTLYKTANGGNAWSKIPTPGAGTQIVGLAVDASSRVFLGDGALFVSPDGGTTWTASDVVQYPAKLDADPRDPATIYATLEQASLRWTSDGGLTWTTVPGIGDAKCAAAVANGELLVGTTERGVLRSSGQRQAFAESNAGLRGARAFAVAVTNEVAPTVYVTTDRGPVFASVDGGASWQKRADLDAGTGYALTVDPSTPTTLYAAAQSGVERSTDGGAHWQRVLSTQAVAILVDPGDSATIYAGTQTDGVQKSVTSGDTWSAAGLAGSYVYSLAADARAAGTLYAWTFDDKQLHKTTDGGAHWSVLPNAPAGFVSVVAVHPLDSTLAFASTNGVFTSTDGGATFRRGTGQPDSIYPGGVVADPDLAATFYLLTASGGAYRTMDAGATWTDLGYGLDGQSGTGLAVHRGTLYAATLGMGVFRNLDSAR